MKYFLAVLALLGVCLGLALFFSLGVAIYVTVEPGRSLMDGIWFSLFTTPISLLLISAAFSNA